MKGESALCSNSDDIYFSDRPSVQSDNLSLHFSQCEVGWMWSFGSERRRECWCQQLPFLHDLGHIITSFWAWANASWLEDKNTNGCPMDLMWKCGHLTHIRSLLHQPGRKVDPWCFSKKVTLKGHIIRKVVYFFLPVCQWASLWAVRARIKKAAYQSDACSRETVPFQWEIWAPEHHNGAKSPTSTCSPGNGSPRECSGSLYFKDEHFWVLHKIPVLLLKPRRFHKRLAVRHHHRAWPINLLHNDFSSPYFSLPPRDPGKNRYSMGIDDLTIRAEDSNCGWCARATSCSCQNYGN